MKSGKDLGTGRREFLTASLSVISLSGLQADSAVAQTQKSAITEVESRFLRAAFDSTSGRFHAWRKDGTTFLSGAFSRALVDGAVFTVADREYTRTAAVEQFRDALGTGSRIVARCTDSRRRLDFVIYITVYDDRDALVVEVLCRNASVDQPLMIHSVEPVRALADEGGFCHWPGASKALTNGYMYYDPGRLADFDRDRHYPTTSMWNIGLYRGEKEPGLAIGYLKNDAVDGRISVWYRYKEDLELVSESCYNRECVVKPGAGVSSGPLIFHFAADPFTALESYAQAVGDVHRVKLNPVINGWCSWFYTHEYVTEEEVLRNTEYAAQHLKPYGLEYVQIDAGYFRAYGDWEGNAQFPHGMKWLAGKIREAGLKPGIWLAPYVITEGTEVHEKHPEWLIRDLEGKVKQCGGGEAQDLVGPGYGIPSFRKKLYGLDITHPGAAEWIRNLFDTVANDWDYDFIKIDFVEWTLLAADRYHDPSFSKAAAYRKGFEIIRQAIGARRHLLDCGPMNTTVGLLDSTRIELDLPHLTWEQYVKNFNSNAPAIAKRYYFNQRSWINDADHLGVALLDSRQACAAASIIALSGGTMIFGDRLFELDPERLEILRKVLPAYGQAARPVDLFERDKPEIFVLPIKASFGAWTLVALFNYDENATAEKGVSLKKLRLDTAKTYLAYEFWTQKLLGEFQDDVRLTLQPGSVALLALHDKRGVPQVISTDRHFTQGAFELDGVQWDPAASVLHGNSVGSAGTTHRVSVYIPEKYRWDQKEPEYFHDFQGYSVKLIQPDLLRVHVKFVHDRRVPWEVRCAKPGAAP